MPSSILDRAAVTDREGLRAYLESVYDNIDELDKAEDAVIDEHEPYFSELKDSLNISINELKLQPSEELKAEIVDDVLGLFRPIFTDILDLESL